MINSSTIQSTKMRKCSKTDTLVKKTFNKKLFNEQELISDKLYENEKFTETHFHPHNHYDEQFIDTGSDM